MEQTQQVTSSETLLCNFLWLIGYKMEGVESNLERGVKDQVKGKAINCFILINSGNLNGN